MKITIESTDILAEYNGRECRVWRGITESGIPCDVLVPCLRVRSDQQCSQFEAELKELPEPRLPAVSFRQIW